MTARAIRSSAPLPQRGPRCHVGRLPRDLHDRERRGSAAGIRTAGPRWRRPGPPLRISSSAARPAMESFRQPATSERQHSFERMSIRDETRRGQGTRTGELSCASAITEGHLLSTIAYEPLRILMATVPRGDLLVAALIGRATSATSRRALAVVEPLEPPTASPTRSRRRTRTRTATGRRCLPASLASWAARRAR